MKENGTQQEPKLYYDKAGNLTKRIYPNGEVCEYDKNGRLIKIIFSDGDVWEYDEDGNMTKITSKVQNEKR